MLRALAEGAALEEMASSKLCRTFARNKMRRGAEIEVGDPVVAWNQIGRTSGP